MSFLSIISALEGVVLSLLGFVATFEGIVLIGSDMDCERAGNDPSGVFLKRLDA